LRQRVMEEKKCMCGSLDVNMVAALRELRIATP